MGHVWALRQFGFAAPPPMFIPFLGAFVESNSIPRIPIEDARVGLAGPIWGTAFAIARLLCVQRSTDQPAVGAIAHFAAWINLFNLLPVWQLDGARGFSCALQSAAISSSQSWLAAGSLIGRRLSLCARCLRSHPDFCERMRRKKATRKRSFNSAGLLIVLSMLWRSPLRA